MRFAFPRPGITPLFRLLKEFRNGLMFPALQRLSELPQILYERPQRTAQVLAVRQGNIPPHFRGAGSDIALANREHLGSEEHTSELQSLTNIVCRLLLEKKNNRRVS